MDAYNLQQSGANLDLAIDKWLELLNGELKGDTGNGISKIERTSGNGAVGTQDTYTITYTNGNATTFKVTNGSIGRGITSFVRTSGNGAVGTTDTYTVTYNDNTTTSFTVKNGYAPIRGTDYWTEADMNTIKAYVDSAILGGSW